MQALQGGETRFMNTSHTIAVDAVGGDAAPRAVIEGAVSAMRDLGIPVMLVGPQSTVRDCLHALGAAHLPIQICDAPDRISMDDEPIDVFKKKPHASIPTGVRQLTLGTAQAFVSAGNSGAVISASVFHLKKISGIDRPAIAAILPTPAGPALLADAGAGNVCKPYHLSQFAIMCSVYSRWFLGHNCPRVGLLCNGSEEIKGTPLLRQANTILKQTSIHYTGYIEGMDIFRGAADVIICDGFTGNIILKTIEGVGECFSEALTGTSGSSLLARVSTRLAARPLQRLLQRFDYAEYGGAPLLGVNGTVVIAHGRSSARAIKNAIRTAAALVASRSIRHLQHDLDIRTDLHSVARKPTFLDRVLHRSTKKTESLPDQGN